MRIALAGMTTLRKASSSSTKLRQSTTARAMGIQWWKKAR